MQLARRWIKLNRSVHSSFRTDPEAGGTTDLLPADDIQQLCSRLIAWFIELKIALCVIGERERNLATEIEGKVTETELKYKHLIRGNKSLVKILKINNPSARGCVWERTWPSETRWRRLAGHAAGTARPPGRQTIDRSATRYWKQRTLLGGHPSIRLTEALANSNGKTTAGFVKSRLLPVTPWTRMDRSAGRLSWQDISLQRHSQFTRWDYAHPSFRATVSADKKEEKVAVWSC